MAQRVTLQYRETQEELPSAYVLPPDSAFEFASSVVRVDGSGAADTFVVVLDVLSQDAKLVASARTDQEFGVGDTGVVSFAPFLRRAPAAAAGAAGVQVARQTGATTTSGAGLTPLELGAFDGPHDGTSITADGAGRLNLNAAGVYMLDVRAVPTFVNPITTETWIELTRISGAHAHWSSQLAVFNDGFATLGSRIFSAAAGIDAVVSGDSALLAVGAIEPGDTVPAIYRLSLNVTEDKVDVVRVVSWRVTVTRIGDVFA